MSILKGKKRQKLSFTSINNLIIIPITLNGKELSFILDSGARKTILFGSANSDSLVLNNQTKIKVRGLGYGKTINAIVSKNNRIKIDNIYGYNQTIYVILNDKFNLTSRMGTPIHGIIGYELLKNFVTSINYQSNKLTFYKPSKFKIPQLTKYKKFDLDFHQDKPYINTLSYLSDSISHQTKLLLDTGCSDALWLFENKSKNLIPRGKFFLDYLGEGLNGSVEGKRSKIKSFKIGEFVFNNITTAFLDSVSTLHARLFKERDGSIGSSLLERFHVIFDYPNAVLYLKKARSFKKDFQYNRAGLGIAYHKDAREFRIEKKFSSKINIGVHDDGRYKDLFEIEYQYTLKPLYYVYYIRPNSPAAKAGVKLGDFLSAINGKPAVDYELGDIINLFYGAKGETIKLTIKRNGSPYYYEFKLAVPI